MGDSHVSNKELFWIVVLGFIVLIGVWVACRRRHQMQHNHFRRFTGDSVSTTINTKRNAQGYYKQGGSPTQTNTNVSRTDTELLMIDALGRAKYIPFPNNKPPISNNPSSVNTNAFETPVNSMRPITIDNNDLAPNNLNNYVFVSIKQPSFDNSFEWQIFGKLSQNAKANLSTNTTPTTLDENVASDAKSDELQVIGSLKRLDSNSFSNWIVNILNKEIEIKQIDDSSNASWYCGEIILRASKVPTMTEWKVGENIMFSIKKEEDGSENDLNCWKSSDLSFVMNVVSKDNYSQWNIVDSGKLSVDIKTGMIFAALLTCKIQHYITLPKE